MSIKYLSVCLSVSIQPVSCGPEQWASVHVHTWDLSQVARAVQNSRALGDGPGRLSASPVSTPPGGDLPMEKNQCGPQKALFGCLWETYIK